MAVESVLYWTNLTPDVDELVEPLGDRLAGDGARDALRAGIGEVLGELELGLGLVARLLRHLERHAEVLRPPPARRR